MKLITLLMMIGLMQASASGYGQNITLKEQNISIEKLFKAIEQKSGYVFFYNREDLPQIKLNINISNATIEEAIKVSMKDLPLNWEIVKQNIFLSKKAPSILDKVTSLFDDINVKGYILDDKNQPLAGATIVVKGTNKTVKTDRNGAFYLTNVNEKAILIISYVGYHTRELKAVSDMGTLILEISDSKLDEVMVKAYGTTTRRLNTGSISKVSAEEIGNQPISNPLAALEGRVPGLVVTQESGLPGGQFKVQVQGRTSVDRTISNDQPLFIIDGIPMANNSNSINKQTSSLGNPANNGILTDGYSTGLSAFSSVNSRDIESMEILKGADATAIYGSRGANGVVLITTKKGQAGNTKLDFNIYSGFSKNAEPVQFANTSQYVALRKAAFKNDNVVPTNANAYDFMVWDTTRNTNFYKILDQNTAHLTNANLSVSGGTKNTQYLISGNYSHQSTVMAGDTRDNNASFHFNLSNNSTNERFKSILTAGYTSDDNNLLTLDLSSRAAVPPNMRYIDDNGGLLWNEGGITTTDALTPNPLAALKNRYKVGTKNLIGSLQLSYLLLKGLTLRSNLGYNFIQSNEANQMLKSSYNPLSNPTNSAQFNDNQYVSQIFEPQIQYKSQFKDLKLDILAGGSYQSDDYDGMQTLGAGYSSDDLLNSLTGYTSVSAKKFKSQYKYEAVFSQANLNWKDKYIINVAARRDGSSRFGDNKKFANFGSVGAAWLFSNEHLIQDNISWLSFGKLRASMGITGNDKITNYQYLDTWASVGTTYAGNAALYPSKLYNPDYRWEKNSKDEIALELGFLKDRILFGTTYYNNTSSNPLVNYMLPSLTGFSSVVVNLPAKVRNKGWEFTLTTTNVKTQDFSWTTTANLTLPQNRLISFQNLQTSSYKNTYVIGQSLSVIYKYKYLGVDPQTGLSQFEDKNKDGKLSADDYQAQGSTDPKFYGGLQNSIRYKKLQFDFLFSFRKQTGISYLLNVNTPPGMIRNIPAVMTGFWTKPGDIAQFQMPTQAYGAAYTAWSNLINYSNAGYTDASFIRLKNVSLSYTLPENWLNKLKISSARLYVQGQNLLTITNYQVGDPESQNLFQTPPLRTMVFGIQFSL